MQKQKQSKLPGVIATYRVPLRSVFNAKHIKGDPSWDDIYGKKKCCHCLEHFKEGQAYRMAKNNEPYHVECP